MQHTEDNALGCRGEGIAASAGGYEWTAALKRSLLSAKLLNETLFNGLATEALAALIRSLRERRNVVPVASQRLPGKLQPIRLAISGR